MLITEVHLEGLQNIYLSNLVEILEAVGLSSYLRYWGVTGRRHFKETEADLVVELGGRSPMDAAKLIVIERFPNLEIKSMGEGLIFGSSKPSKKHIEAARGAWEACLRDIFSLNHRLVVLDEINIATHLGLVHPERVREMMFLKPRNLHIILSGRNAHPEMKEHASAVFEMREIKHPFHRGIQARRGIEF